MQRHFLSAAMLVVSVAAASIGYSDVFEGWSFAVRLIGAAIVAAGIVLVAPAAGIRRRLSPVAVVLGWFLYLCYGVLSSTLSLALPTGTTIRELFDGLTDGWPTALDDFLPLAPNNSVLVVIVTVVFAATAVATDLIANTSRVSLPIFAPLVVLGVSLPLSAPAGNQRWWFILLTALAILGYVLVRANPTHDLEATQAGVVGTDYAASRTLSTVLLRGAPMVAAASLVGMLLATPLSFGRDDPYDPRDEREEALAPQPIVNPLASFKAISAQDPPSPAFSVDFVIDEDRALVERIPLVVLDTYDGQTWRSTQRFSVTDGDLGADETIDAEARSIAQRYSLGAVPGPWLPAASRPVQIDAVGISFDAEAGMLLGDVNNYVVVSRVPELETLVTADVDTERGEAFERYWDLPDAFSAEMATLADEITLRAQTDYEQLLALEAYFASDFGYDPEARSGHSLGRVEELLIDNRVGSAEQYATVYALLARSLGLPTRLVVGYDLTDVVDADGDGALDVTSAAYDVWAEVRFDGGYGWVAIDPTPVDATVDANPEPAPGTTIAQGQAASQSQAPSEAGPSEAPSEDLDVTDSVGSWVYPAFILGFLLLWAVIFAVVIVLTKMRRRTRRRKHTNVAGRVEGAWADARDRLLESGVGVESTMTMAEVVQAGNAEFGSEVVAPLKAMVPEVSRTVYGQISPQGDAAERVWEQADNFSYTLRTSRTARGRLKAKLNPKPLLRR